MPWFSKVHLTSSVGAFSLKIKKRSKHSPEALIAGMIVVKFPRSPTCMECTASTPFVAMTRLELPGTDDNSVSSRL